MLASSAAQAEPLELQIEKNWNFRLGAQCPRDIELRVTLAADGKVEGLEPTEPIAPDDADCREIMESLRRAILLSSPLQFEGEVPPSVLLRFGHEIWLQ